jgi:hypothetical protein
MEARIHVDENEHNSVAGYGNYKDQENEGKEKPGERSIAEQTEEDKVSIHGIIAPLHNSVGFTKDRGGYGRKMEKIWLIYNTVMQSQTNQETLCLFMALKTQFPKRTVSVGLGYFTSYHYSFKKNELGLFTTTC